MTVSNISNGIPWAEEESLFKPVGKQELDQNDFMTLFITQLQYQDPMKPMDSYEMASQLAQFSNMEATMKMADNMEELLEYQTSQNNLQLLSLLDNKVRVQGNSFGVNEGEIGGAEFTLTDYAETCVVEIYDAADHLVDILDMGPTESGTYTLDWDGTNMADETVEDGAYGYVVKGYTALGEEVEVDYQAIGTVTGVNFADGQAMLMMDNYVKADVGSVVGVL